MCWRPVSGEPIGKPRSIFTGTDSPTWAPAAGEVIVTGVLLLPEAALVLVPPPVLQAAATSAGAAGPRAQTAARRGGTRRRRRRAAGVGVSCVVSMPGIPPPAAARISPKDFPRTEIRAGPSASSEGCVASVRRGPPGGLRHG